MSEHRTSAANCRAATHGEPISSGNVCPVCTPAPAPALTDEQIDFNVNFLRQTVAEHSVAGPRIWDRTLAAVIARAKREERERIAAAIAARLTGDKHGCLRHGVDCAACRALDRAIDYVGLATREATNDTD